MQPMLRRLGTERRKPPSSALLEEVIPLVAQPRHPKDARYHHNSQIRGKFPRDGILLGQHGLDAPSVSPGELF